jgi:hypothetical protein
VYMANGNADGGSGSGSGSGRYGSKKNSNLKGDSMSAAAARALSDTGLDVKAFGDALARIQMHASASASASANGYASLNGSLNGSTKVKANG